MGAIPLIIEGPNRTVVESMQEFEAAGGLEGTAILIQGLDRNQFLSPDDTNISYDLCVGCEYRDHRDIGKKDLSQDGIIEFLPGTGVIIETEEFVHFPKLAFGHIVPKVDPEYNGKLLITVFNLGKKTVQLRRGERFCALYVLQVLEGARPYDKPPKRIVGEARRRIWQRLRDLLEVNSALVMVVLIIVTLILIIVQIIQFIPK